MSIHHNSFPGPHHTVQLPGSYYSTLLRLFLVWYWLNNFNNFRLILISSSSFSRQNNFHAGSIKEGLVNWLPHYPHTHDPKEVRFLTKQKKDRRGKYSAPVGSVLDHMSPWSQDFLHTSYQIQTITNNTESVLILLICGFGEQL